MNTLINQHTLANNFATRWLNTDSCQAYWLDSQEGINKLLNDCDDDGLHLEALKLHLQVHLHQLAHKAGCSVETALKLEQSFDWDLTAEFALLALVGFMTDDSAYYADRLALGDEVVEDPMPLC
jgi:hypothetical protein